MRRPSDRRGFGAYYMVVVLVLMALGAASLTGLRSMKSTAKTARRSASEEMHKAAEQYLALGLGLVQNWANNEGGPPCDTAGDRPLYKVFREYLLRESAENVYLPIDLEASIGESLGGLVSERFQLEDGKVYLTIVKGKRFGTYGYHRGARIKLQVKVADRGAEEPRLPLRLYTSWFKYTVTAPTAPPPFDAYVLAIRHPQNLIGDDWNVNVENWTTDMLEVPDVIADYLEDIQRMRDQVTGAPPGYFPDDVLPRLDALRDELQAVRPRKSEVPTVAETDRNDTQVLVAAAGLADAPIDLNKLVLVPKIENTKAALADLKEQIREVEQERTQAEVRLFSAKDITDLEQTVNRWKQLKLRLWEEFGTGLTHYLHFLAQGTETKPASAFKKKGVSYWDQFLVSAWRDKAHYQISGSTTEELAQALEELTSTVSPINGIVHVNNAAEDAEAATLVLRGGEHGLTGRFVLAVEGNVRLEDFVPYGAGEGGERSRAVVVSKKDMILAGTVEAAVFCHGTLGFEGNGVLKGALYVGEVRDLAAFEAGTVERLGDDEIGEGRFRSKGDAGFRDHHMLVTIDPVAEKKKVE